MNLKEIIEAVEKVKPLDRREWLEDHEVFPDLWEHILRCFPEHNLKDMDGSLICLDVVDQQDDHFIVRFAEPGRVEVSLICDPQRPPDEGHSVMPKTRIIARIYQGAEILKDQGPLVTYDGTRDDNESWGS